MSDPADVRWHVLNDIMSQYYLGYHRIFWLNGLKLCIWDAQMSNAVYVPTPPYVMGLSQASWLVSCVSRTHRCPMLSMLPRHVLTTHCLALYCNVISNVCWLSTS